MELELFNENINPCDFNITFEQISQKEFLIMVNQVASFPVESQIGRRFCFLVRHDNQILGFIRLNSPVISIGNRNTLFGSVLRANQINDHMMNGSVIVPNEFFGFNYLGGKLLTLICISNEMGEIIKEKTHGYCYFETTSLYGNLKQSSQYDGMEPMLRKFGLTESNLLMYPTNHIFNELRNHIEPVYGLEEYGGRVCSKSGTAPKLREFNKLISVVGQNIKIHFPEKYSDFQDFKKNRMRTLTKKGYYYSTLGYSNVIEHINTGAPLIEYDKSRYDWKNLFAWWVRKATKRQEILKAEGRFLAAKNSSIQSFR